MATAIINHQSLHMSTYGDMAAWTKGEEALGPLLHLSPLHASCHHPHKADAFVPFHRSNELLQVSWSHGHLPLFPARWLKDGENPFLYDCLCGLMSPLLKARTATIAYSYSTYYVWNMEVSIDYFWDL